MENLIQKQYQYALVGASNNEEKYGYKVMKDLTDAGYSVIPINPKEEQIYGKTVKHSLDELENIDVVIYVVPPAITLTILEQANKKGFKKAWFQPGSTDEKTKAYCDKNNFTYVNNMCIMVQKDV
jgi:predicted CoA-binding protein